MRKIALLVLGTGALALHVYAYAESDQIFTRYDFMSATGTTGTINSTQGVTVNQHMQTLGYRTEGLRHGFDLGLAMITTVPDYSTIQITDRSGNTHLLSQDYSGKPELKGSTDLTYTRGSHRAALSWTGSVSDTPFPSQLLTVGYNEGFLQQTTIIGVSATVAEQRQPESYFIDRDFKTKPRPTLVHASAMILSGEQILTDRWKTRLELSTGIREEERPRNLGATLKESYALTDRLFARLALSDISELHNQALKDENGYYTLRSAQTGLIYEPIYDLLLSCAYTVAMESETDPRIDREVQVGSDHFGLGLKYTYKTWELSMSAAYLITNTSLHGLDFGGGIAWKI